MDDYTKELLEAAGESEAQPLAATFTVCSDLVLIARAEAGQFAFDMSTFQAEELGKQLTRAARRGTVKYLKPLSCAPHIRTLDTTPYRVTMATDAPVPWSGRFCSATEGPVSDRANISILELSPQAIEFDGPELELRWEHDPLRVVGRVRGFFLQPGRLIGTAFFDTAPFAQEIRKRVDAGEVSELSLAAQVEEWTTLPDGARRVTRWRPIELSIEPPAGSGDPQCRIVPMKDHYRGN
jgi:hypothetical protein